MRHRHVTAENRKWWTLAAVGLGLFMIMLDNTVVNVALPTIQRDLGAELPELEWIVSGYALVFASLMLTGGRLADLLGRRRIYVGGLALFSASSLACALAPSAGFLIGARVGPRRRGSAPEPRHALDHHGDLSRRERGTALGRTAVRRKGWDNYDLLSGSGVRVEVKASGYLQSWAQAKHSRLDFGRVAARSWDENTNEFSAEPEVRADVFVFAVQTCRDPTEYNALDIVQWEFYVMPAEHVRACGYKSVTISWVRRYAEPVAFAGLAEAIEAAADGVRRQP